MWNSSGERLQEERLEYRVKSETGPRNLLFFVQSEHAAVADVITVVAVDEETGIPVVIDFQRIDNNGLRAIAELLSCHMTFYDLAVHIDIERHASVRKCSGAEKAFRDRLDRFLHGLQGFFPIRMHNLRNRWLLQLPADRSEWQAQIPVIAPNIVRD